jgi:hypothetical protein
MQKRGENTWSNLFAAAEPEGAAESRCLLLPSSRLMPGQPPRTPARHSSAYLWTRRLRLVEARPIGFRFVLCAAKPKRSSSPIPRRMPKIPVF